MTPTTTSGSLPAQSDGATADRPASIAWWRRGPLTGFAVDPARERLAKTSQLAERPPSWRLRDSLFPGCRSSPRSSIFTSAPAAIVYADQRAICPSAAAPYRAEKVRFLTRPFFFPLPAASHSTSRDRRPDTFVWPGWGTLPAPPTPSSSTAMAASQPGNAGSPGFYREAGWSARPDEIWARQSST